MSEAPPDTEVCGVRNAAEHSYMADRFACSLPPGHGPDIPHRAYVNHVATGDGRDLAWLGPWEDGTAWDDAEATRLSAEWGERFDPTPYEADIARIVRQVRAVSSGGAPVAWTLHWRAPRGWKSAQHRDLGALVDQWASLEARGVVIVSANAPGGAVVWDVDMARAVLRASAAAPTD